MFRFVLPLCILAVALGCRKANHDECERVIDRYVSMKIDDDPALLRVTDESRSNSREARLAKKRSEPAYGARIEQCTREADPAEIACGMNAKGPDEWESCFQ